MNNYVAEILATDGSTLNVLDGLIEVDAARSFNTEGSCRLTLPYNRLDYHQFQRNTRMILWRTDVTGRTANFGDTVWFAKKVVRNVLDNTFAVEFVDAFAMLNVRVVGYTPVTPYADKTLEEFGLTSYTDYFRIDNLMREYVRENFGPDTISPITGLPDTDRIIGEIDIEDDKNLAPYGEKQAGWANVADVLRDLARMSAENGTELFYDLVPIPLGRFEFRVWSDVRGVDRSSTSATPLEFTAESGQLDDIEEEVDWSEVGTFCYVLGYDTDNSRIWEGVDAADLVNTGPFAREEFTINLADSDVSDVLIDAGESALNGRRPQRRITASVIDGGDILYGRDYRYGDKVVVKVLADTYDCHVSAARVSWRDGNDDLDIRLTGSKAI